MSAVSVVFQNSSDGEVKVYWLDFEGNEKLYKNLAAGDQYKQDTYVGHPWIVRMNDKERTAVKYFTPTNTTKNGEVVVVSKNINDSELVLSINSNTPKQITFINKYIAPVKINWVDFKGKEVNYSTLEVGRTWAVNTYCTHPWRIRDNTTSQEVMLWTADTSTPDGFTVEIKVVNDTSNDRRAEAKVKATYKEYMNNPDPASVDVVLSADLATLPRLAPEIKVRLVKMGYAVYMETAKVMDSRIITDLTMATARAKAFIPLVNDSWARAKESEFIHNVALRKNLKFQAPAYLPFFESSMSVDTNDMTTSISSYFDETKFDASDVDGTFELVKAKLDSFEVVPSGWHPSQAGEKKTSSKMLGSVSANSDRAINDVRFSNASSSTVEVLWLNFQGIETKYTELAPKGVWTVNTYETHPWLVRRVSDGEILKAFTSDGTTQQGHTVITTDHFEDSELPISDNSNHQVQVNFENICGIAVSIFWSTFEGHEQQYTTLDPGGTWCVDTYVTHPWRIRDPHGREVMLFTATMDTPHGHVVEIIDRAAVMVDKATRKLASTPPEVLANPSPEDTDILLCVDFKSNPEAAVGCKRYLQAAGYSVFLDTGLFGGSTLLSQQVARKAKAMLPMINLEWNESNYCQFTMSTMAHRNMAEGDVSRIFPVIIGSFDWAAYPMVDALMCTSNASFLHPEEPDTTWEGLASMLKAAGHEPRSQEVNVEFFSLNPDPVTVYLLDDSGGESEVAKIGTGQRVSVPAADGELYIAKRDSDGYECCQYSLHFPKQGDVFTIGKSPGDSAVPKSLPGTRAVKGVSFLNRMPDPVTVNWCTFDGPETTYTTLSPGQSWVVDTYVTHAWRIRNERDGQEVMMWIPGTDTPDGFAVVVQLQDEGALLSHAVKEYANNPPFDEIDVMISLHCASCAKLTTRLKEALMLSELKVWICLDMAAGESYRKSIVKAARHCKVFVPLLNKDWVESNECKFEAMVAVKRRRAGAEPAFMPMVVGDVGEETDLVKQIYSYSSDTVVYFPQREKAAFDKLAAAIQKLSF